MASKRQSRSCNRSSKRGDAFKERRHISVSFLKPLPSHRPLSCDGSPPSRRAASTGPSGSRAQPRRSERIQNMNQQQISSITIPQKGSVFMKPLRFHSSSPPRAESLADSTSSGVWSMDQSLDAQTSGRRRRQLPTTPGSAEEARKKLERKLRGCSRVRTMSDGDTIYRTVSRVRLLIPPEQFDGMRVRYYTQSPPPPLN